ARLELVFLVGKSEYGEKGLPHGFSRVQLWKKGGKRGASVWAGTVYHKTRKAPITRGGVYSNSKIVTVTHVEVERKYDYGFLIRIDVKRADREIYTFKESDYSRLSLNDIRDLYLPKVQGKLHHLPSKAEYDLANSLLIFIIRIDEVFKFGDGTIIKIKEELETMLGENKIRYKHGCLKARMWTTKDIKRSKRMMNEIKSILKARNKMRFLESYGEGRPKTEDQRSQRGLAKMQQSRTAYRLPLPMTPEDRDRRGSASEVAQSRRKDRGLSGRQDERVFPTVADWHVSSPKDEMPAEETYSSEAVAVLNTHCTPIQKQPEALLCLVGLSQRYFLGDDVYPTFLHDDDQDMDLFNLIHALNPTKVKIDTHPRAAHEVSLLTVTTSRVIEMEDPDTITDSSGVPSTIERSPLDFANENPSQQSTGGDGMEDQGQETVALDVPPPKNVTTTRVALEVGLVEEIAAMGLCVIKEHRKKGNDVVYVNAPPKVLRKYHADSRPTQSTVGGKSFALMGLGTGSTFPVPTPQETPADVSDLDLLSFANPHSIPKENVAQSSNRASVAGDPESENTSFTSMVRSPESIYQPEWGVTNSCHLDTPEACQDLVDHIASPGYFSKMRYLHNDDFLR
nr:hypothetical protein [Tanacetum cinerariifolium]